MILNPQKANKTIIDLSKWYTLDHPGTYQVVVMQRFTSWEQPAFLTSNLATITVTAQ